VAIHRSSGWLGFDPECDPTDDDIMRALEPEVVDAVWVAIEPLIPPVLREHYPLAVTGPGSRIDCAFGGSSSG
jgi:hypothetical protein